MTKVKDPWPTIKDEVLPDLIAYMKELEKKQFATKEVEGEKHG